MKRTLTDKIPFELPSEIVCYTKNAKIYDSSCSPEARVYFLDTDGGYYLKISEPKTLLTEAKMTDYFHNKGLGAEVMSYVSAERDFMLTRRVAGEDATHERFISEPKKLCDRLAEYLRELHELQSHDSPVKNRNEAYLALAEKNYKLGIGDLSLTEDLFPFRSSDEAYAILNSGKDGLKGEVLLHGDYCLPNVMLNDNFTLSGYIDVGNGGIGDRHIDLFWGTWTLYFNLKTDRYRSRFLDAYGRDKVNEEMLRTVAAAEVFG